MTKWVYRFGDGAAEGRADMRNLLGGKGAGLAEMSNLGLLVPPGMESIARPGGVLGACIWACATPAARISASVIRVRFILRPPVLRRRMNALPAEVLRDKGCGQRRLRLPQRCR